MQKPSQCAKCGGTLVEGFILDETHGSHDVSTWVEDPPVKSFWVGHKLAGKEKIEVRTFRCTRCGYLENYALP